MHKQMLNGYSAILIKGSHIPLRSDASLLSVMRIRCNHGKAMKYSKKFIRVESMEKQLTIGSID